MKRYLIIAAALPLSACISFGAKPPPSLLTLTSATAPTANAGRSVNASEAITVAVPAVPQAIASTRVPVSVNATAIAYVEDAVWVEAPARLFQRLLSETITAKTRKTVLDPKQSALVPAMQLTGQLLRFGVDETTSDAVIVYDAVLTHDAGKTVMTRRFEARSKAATITAKPVGDALNLAANSIATDIATWVGEIK
ncbi:MAG: ABC-type transport auxiliary lipoprotein family protein [Pseudomonadota bacterium]